MSYLFYGINSAIKYARDGYSKELSDFLSKKPHLINQKNRNGNSILHIACWKGDCDMVLMLLMRGAHLNVTDSKGYTPLLVAIEFGHDLLATSLLERGANINIANQTLCYPLHVAALSGSKNMIIPLLQRGADINAIETNGCTPLLCALRNKNSDVALILIDKGADLSARDGDDWLPIGLAKTSGMTAVVTAISLRFEMTRDRSMSEMSQKDTRSLSSSGRERERERENSRERGPKQYASQSAKHSSPPLTSFRLNDTPDHDISAKRSQSNISLAHTMTSPGFVEEIGGEESMVSASATSKGSKREKSSKKKQRERRNTVSEMSAMATTAAIEAVTKAMKESGGDVAQAALALMRQRQQSESQKEASRRKSNNGDGESKDDEFSVSVISRSTLGSSRPSGKTKKNRKSRGSLADIDDDERSMQSESTRGSLSSGIKKTKSSGSRRGGSMNGDTESRKSMSDWERSQSLLPIEERLVTRNSSSRRGESKRGDSSFYDDVDSDGEPAGPPALFCFWGKPPTIKRREGKKLPSSNTSCTVM